jgi:hypothetical protein
MVLPNVLAFHELTMPWPNDVPWPSPHHGLGPNPTTHWKFAAKSWSLQELVDLTQHPPTPRKLDFGALLTVVESEFGVECYEEAKSVLEFARPVFVSW